MSLRRTLPALAVAFALAISPAWAQNNRDSFLKTNPQLMATLQSVAEKPSEFTVRVLSGEKDVTLGTIVGADGWIITKYSELKSESTVKLKDGRTFSAKLVGVHVPSDLAMLKIDAKGLPVAVWRDSKEDGVGSWVISTGTGKDPVAVGVISVNARPLAGPRVLPNPNSGYLGVQMEPGEGGVVIRDVLPSTAASKVGLKVGDVVIGIDDVTITDVDSMMETLRNKKAGEKVTIKIKRDGKPMEFVAELGKRPATGIGRGDFQNAMGSTLSDRRTGFPMILQHDTVLKPSECGGPLVDLDGKVVGINIARAGRTESYALPSEFVRPLLADLQAGKLPPPKNQVSTSRIKELEDSLKKLNEEKAALEKKIKEAQESLENLKEKK